MNLKPGAGQELRKGRDTLLAWHLNDPGAQCGGEGQPPSPWTPEAMDTPGLLPLLLLEPRGREAG